MAAMLPSEQISANIRTLLADNVACYRNFGVYWYFVKAFLKRHYGRTQIPILGAYEQPDVVARMPAYETFEEAMHDALLTWRANYENNMGSATSIGPDDEPVTLFDEDIGL